MMEQFKVSRAIYAGYTVFTLVWCDIEGYLEGEKTLYSESNNVRLNQNFR